MRWSRPADLTVGAELGEWRDRVRSFMAAEMAPGRVEGHIDASDLTGLDRDFERAHHRAAAAEGFLAVSLPAHVGGGGRPRSWKHVFDLEAAYFGAPSIDTGVTLCGAPLARYGSVEQQARWLAPMVAGDINGAIAYSEPQAGNDVSAIVTTASRSTDGWVLSGVKAHVTGGHKAEMAIVLARTDPGGPPRRTMSMFLVPLDADGVTIRRRQTINRWTLSEITFNDVRLDESTVLGEPGQGWSQMLGAMSAERGSLSHLGWAERRLERLPSTVDPTAAARARTDLYRVRAYAQRLIDLEEAGETVGHESSVVKVLSTELLQRIARLARGAAGSGGDAWHPLWEPGPTFAYDSLEWIHASISVGGNETHRDMIATALFDRDPARPIVPPPPPSSDVVLERCSALAAESRAIYAIAVRASADRALFGRRVIDFQAARHRLVEMAITTEAMELMTAQAAIAPPQPGRDALMAATSTACREGIVDVTEAAHQLAGAEGYYDDGTLAGRLDRAWQAAIGTIPAMYDPRTPRGRPEGPQ